MFCPEINYNNVVRAVFSSNRAVFSFSTATDSCQLSPLLGLLTRRPKGWDQRDNPMGPKRGAAVGGVRHFVETNFGQDEGQEAPKKGTVQALR